MPPGGRYRSCSTLTATRTKRILSIQPVAERGGSDRALARLVRSLAQEGWDCHIALPAPSPMAEEFEAAGAHAHVVPMRRITTSGSTGLGAYLPGWPVAVARLVVLARRLGVDVIHSNSLHSWYGWAVAVVRPPPRLARPGDRGAVGCRAAPRAPAVPALRRHSGGGVEPRWRPSSTGPTSVVGYDGWTPTSSTPAGPGTSAPVSASPTMPRWSAWPGRIDTWKGVEVLLDAVAGNATAATGRASRRGRAAGRRKEAYAAGWGSGGGHGGSPLARTPLRHGRVDRRPGRAGAAVHRTGTVRLGLVEALASGVPVVARPRAGPSRSWAPIRAKPAPARRGAGGGPPGPARQSERAGRRRSSSCCRPARRARRRGVSARSCGRRRPPGTSRGLRSGRQRPPRLRAFRRLGEAAASR